MIKPVTSSPNDRKPSEQDKAKEIMDIKEFTKHVEAFAKNKTDFIFRNPGIEHAGVVLCAMAEHANESMFVFDENLEGDITSNTNFYEKLESFLRKGGHFEIITKTQPIDNPSRKKLLELKENFADKVQVLYLENYNQIDEDLIKNCFTVTDETAYRLEYDFTNRKAFFNFNDPEKSRKLLERFRSLRKNSISI